MVRKSEVFVEYEPGSEMPLRWAHTLADDLRRSGLYRAVRVSRRRRSGDGSAGAVAMGRVWVDRHSSGAVTPGENGARVGAGPGDHRLVARKAEEVA